MTDPGQGPSRGRSTSCVGPATFCWYGPVLGGPGTARHHEACRRASRSATRPSSITSIHRRSFGARSTRLFDWIAERKLKIRNGGEYPLAEAAKGPMPIWKAAIPPASCFWSHERFAFSNSLRGSGRSPCGQEQPLGSGPRTYANHPSRRLALNRMGSRLGVDTRRPSAGLLRGPDAKRHHDHRQAHQEQVDTNQQGRSPITQMPASLAR